MISNWTEFWGLIVIAALFSLLCKFFSDTSFWLVFLSIVIPGLILEALNSISNSNEKEKNQQKQDLLPSDNTDITTNKRLNSKKKLSIKVLQQIEDGEDKNKTDIEKSIERHNKNKNKK